MEPAHQPTNLLVTFLEYSSVVIQDTKGNILDIALYCSTEQFRLVFFPDFVHSTIIVQTLGIINCHVVFVTFLKDKRRDSLVEIIGVILYPL